jgi:hypothetical protein
MPRAGQADRVRVEPQGEAYRVTIDFDVIVSPLEPLGFSLEAAEVSFRTKPLLDGTWAVTEFVLPNPMTIHMPGQTTTTRWEGQRFDGIYDPALASFVSFDQTVAATRSEVTGADGEGTSNIGEQTVRGTATDAGDGTVNAEFQQTLRDLVTQQTLSLPQTDPKTPASPPIEFAYSIESGDFEATIEGFDTAGLLELWAYAVARAQESPPNVDEQEVKTLLTDLLPLFRNLDEGGTLSGLRVGTPVGEFGVEDISFRMALPGIVERSGVALSLTFSGPSFPDQLVPPWARDLVPTKLDFGFDVSGFNLDAAARHLLDTFDTERTPPLEEADWLAAGQLAMPEQGGNLKLLPGHIDGPLLDVEFEGEMTLAMPAPSGTFTVTATGINDAIASLNGQSGDLQESQALGFLTVAKMWGQPGNDGATEFLFEFNHDGSITVNGQELKPPNAAPL